jgi:hypothetical protein
MDKKWSILVRAEIDDIRYELPFRMGDASIVAHLRIKFTNFRREDLNLELQKHKKRQKFLGKWEDRL